MPSSTFGAADFKVFDVKGFQARMNEIRARIRPKLETLGGRLAPELQRTTGESTFTHVAKHARRRVNPPDDTWVAFAGDARGYKKHCHFKLAVSRCGVRFLFEIGPEHDDDPASPLGDLSAEELVALSDELTRTRDGQLVFGRAVPAAEAEHWTEAQCRSAALETFRALAPLYRLR